VALTDWGHGHPPVPAETANTRKQQDMLTLACLDAGRGARRNLNNPAVFRIKSAWE